MNPLSVCNLPDDLLLPILEKASFDNFIKMRMASKKLHRFAEYYRNHLARNRKDELEATLTISEAHFAISINGTVFTNPKEQLSGLNITLKQITVITVVVNQTLFEDLFDVIIAIFPNMKLRKTPEWIKNPMSTILNIERSAEVLFNHDQVSMAVGRLTEELYNNSDFRFPPRFTIEGFCNSPLPPSLRRVWSSTNGPIYLVLFKVPQSVYVSCLPSGDMMIVFEYFENRSRHPSESIMFLVQEVYQTAKIMIVKKHATDVKSAVDESVSSHSACSNIRIQIQKNIVDQFKE